MKCWVRVPPTEVSLIAGQTGRECKMAHSCRWRFPARPGGSSNSGTGRRAGRIRVTASLRNVSGAHPNAAGLGPGFDAALQVSSAIGSNLQKFRDVLGESSDSSSGEVSTGQGGQEQPGGQSGAPVRQLRGAQCCFLRAKGDCVRPNADHLSPSSLT